MRVRKNRIVVVGSLIIDHYVRVGRFPAVGETVMGDDLKVCFGGKGANQAVAAARLGGEVELIGCVGDDEMGAEYLRRLEGFGIGISGVRSVEGKVTGSAFVTLNAESENTIVVGAGANASLGVEEIEERKRLIADADVLMLQNEVSVEVNLAAMRMAREYGTKVVYNPAPWREGFDFAEWEIDCVVLNEVEAAAFFGEELVSVDQLEDGMVVTRGGEATWGKMGGELYEVRPAPAEVVDTVGAGDTFCGALASRLCGELSWATVLDFANRAAGRSITAMGAQEAMPTEDEL